MHSTVFRGLALCPNPEGGQAGDRGPAGHAGRAAPAVFQVIALKPHTLTIVSGRLATAGLLATLGVLHPRWHFAFLALLMLDVFSHWFQMYAALVSGSPTHKARRLLLRLWVVRRTRHKT